MYLWLEVHVVVQILCRLMLIVAVERCQQVCRGAWSPLFEAARAWRVALLGSWGLLRRLRLRWRRVVVVGHRRCWWRDRRGVGGVGKVLGMLTVRSIAFCAASFKLHRSGRQSSALARWDGTLQGGELEHGAHLIDRVVRHRRRGRGRWRRGRQRGLLAREVGWQVWQGADLISENSRKYFRSIFIHQVLCGVTLIWRKLRARCICRKSHLREVGPWQD